MDWGVSSRVVYENYICGFAAVPRASLLCWAIYIYIYIHIYIYVYLYIYIYIYVYICMYIYIRISMYIYINMPVPIPCRQSYLVLETWIQRFAAGTCVIFPRERLERQALCVFCKCNKKAGRFVLPSILEFFMHRCLCFLAFLSCRLTCGDWRISGDVGKLRCD